MKIFRYLTALAAAAMTLTACEQDAADLFSTEPVAPVMDAHATVLLTENTTSESVTFSWKAARNLPGDVLYTLYAALDAQTISLTTTTHTFYAAPKETLRTQLIDGFSIKPNNNFSIGLYVVADNGTLQLQSETITANVFVYGDYVPAVVSLGADVAEGLVLNENATEKAEILTWEAARFEYGTNPTYKVEALFNDQRTVLAEGLTELSYAVEHSALNGALIAMGCTKEAANELKLIVTASLEGEGAPSLESEAVTVTITPYTPSYPAALSIVGDFGGLSWGDTAATSPILKGSNITGEYHGLVAYYGATYGMKVFYKHPKTDADQWIGGTSEDGVNYTISTAIGDNIAPEAGVYLLYVNLAKGTMKMTPATVGLIGVGGNWDEDVLFTYNAETGLMELKGLEHKAGDFKVRANGGWGKPWDENAQYNLGGDANDMTMDGSNISPEPGVYDVTMNLASNENFKLNLTKTGDVVETKHVWSLVGVGGNWNQAEPPYEMTEGSNGVFSVKNVTLTETDEFKVIMDHSWAGDCGMADGTTITVGQPITLIADGEVNIKVGVAGTYDIYWNPETMKLYVMTAGSEDPTLVEYALIGKFNEWTLGTQVVMEAANNGYVAAKNVNMTGVDLPDNGFKIKENVDNWDNNWGSGTVLELGVPTAVTKGGGNMGLAAEGAYDVYFNPTDLKIIVVTAGADDPTGNVPAPEATSEQIEVGLIGLGGDWDNDVKMTQQTDGSYLVEKVEIKASDIFKVRKAGGWDDNFNWGLETAGIIETGVLVDLKCDGVAGNISVAADGTYNVFFYPTLETGTTKVVKKQPAKIKVEKVEATTPTPGAGFVWDAAVWGPFFETNGGADKNANFDFGNGLQYIAGGAKIRFGADHIQPRAAGDLAANKGLLQLTVAGPGQLVIDISSNNDNGDKKVAIALDGVEIAQKDALKTSAGRQVYTIDCAAAKANSVINVYSLDGAYMLFVMKWIPGEGGSTPAPTPTALATPVVSLDPASVEAGTEKAVAVAWAAVENAASYDVVFNGTAAVNVATNAYTIDAATVKALTKGEYKVSVVAKPAADATAYTQSAAGEATLTVTEAAAPAPATKTFMLVAAELSEKAGELGLPTGTDACKNTAPNGTAWTYNSVGFQSLLAISNATYDSAAGLKKPCLYFYKPSKVNEAITFIKNTTKMGEIVSIKLTMLDNNPADAGNFKMIEIVGGSEKEVASSNAGNGKVMEHLYTFSAGNDGTFNLQNQSTNDLKVLTMEITYKE